MIIRDAKGNKADAHMYAPAYDQFTGRDRGEDLINDWFRVSGDEIFVSDVEYCIDYMRDWVNRVGDFGGEVDSPNNYREIVINGEIYSNW